MEENSDIKSNMEEPNKSSKKELRKMSIEELIEGMTKEGVLDQFEEWPPVGKEIIEW